MGHSYLLELGLEEMPADVISPALAELGRNLKELLAREGVSPASVRSYGTPRRLALLADGLPERQPGREELVLGPPVRVALGPDGEPGKAAFGFARSQGLNVELLERIETPKGEYLGYRKRTPGRSVPENTPAGNARDGGRPLLAARHGLAGEPVSIHPAPSLVRGAVGFPGRLLPIRRNRFGKGHAWPPVPGKGSDPVGSRSGVP